jgi:hypothetical protein
MKGGIRSIGIPRCDAEEAITMMRRQRFLFLILVAGIALLTAACSGGGDMVGSDKGQVRIVMTSTEDPLAAGHTAPDSISAQSGSTVSPILGEDHDHDDDDREDGCACRRLKAANVTFSSVLARNIDGEFIDTSMNLPRTLDMLGFNDRGRIELPAGFLPPGIYDLILVNITKVEFVLLNDLKISIEPPLGGWVSRLEVRPRPFEVIEGETTTVLLRFYPHRMFKVKDGKFKFEIKDGFEIDD